MAINRKGSRKITVDEETYIWRVRDNADHIQIVVQHENEKHQFLSASTPSGIMLYGKTPPITPSIIEKMIRTALAKGWDPFQKTGKAITPVEIELPEEWTFEGFWNIKTHL